MKNFDEIFDQDTEEARTFQVLGEQFVLRAAIRPERFSELLAPIEALRAKDESSIGDVMVEMDAMVVAMIEPDNDAEARWKALREREDGGLSAARLRQIHEWMLERQAGVIQAETGFPTTPPRASSPGPGRPRGR